MNLAIGVIQKRAARVWQVQPAVMTAECFATSLSDRYATHSLLVSRADLALRLEPGLPSPVHEGNRIEISPSIFLTQQRVFAEVDRVESVIPATVGTFDEGGATALFERLFSRHRRTSTFRAAQAAADNAKPVVMATAKREVTAAPQAKPKNTEAAPVRIEDISVALERAAKMTMHTADSGWGTPAPAASEAKAFTLPAPEVRRVAAEVMREIEHRANAARERMGRR